VEQSSAVHDQDRADRARQFGLDENADLPRSVTERFAVCDHP
jgi:hypothetical protein